MKSFDKILKFTLVIQFSLFFGLNSFGQLCYTPENNSNWSSSSDCDDIDYIYNTITSVTIKPRFHFISFQGFQFECNHPNNHFNANLFIETLLEKFNQILGNFAANENGGSQLPNNGDSKIRFNSSPEIYECSNIYFWDDYESFENSELDQNYLNIVFYEKESLDEDNNIVYKTSGRYYESHIELYNAHHAIFVEEGYYTSVTSDYDGVFIHELFHGFGLQHIWICGAECGDLDPEVECGGVTSSGVSCGGICADFADDGVYNNSNNTMGYNDDQDALSNCQYVQAFEKIVEEKPYKTVVYSNADQACDDIIIGQSQNFTTIWECDKYLECNLEVESGRELIMKNILVEMGEGTSIILHPGSRLILEGARIQGIETEKGYWEGIKVLKGDASEQYDDPYYPIEDYSQTKPGTVIMKRGETSVRAYLKDANIGIHVGEGFSKYPGGGLLSLDYAEIKNCYVGIQFERFNHYNKSELTFYCDFSNTQDIIIKSNFGFNFQNPRFTGNFNSTLDNYGIILYNSTIDKLEAPFFSNRKVGLLAFGSHPNLPGFTIGDDSPNTTRFNNCDVGVFLATLGFGAVDNMKIKNSKFENCKIGIFALGESEYNINSNTFINNQEEMTSVAAFSTGNATNDCYCNTITNSTILPESVGFLFDGINSNSIIYSNDFNYINKSAECIKTQGEGDIFSIQATEFDPLQQLDQNNPAANNFKDYNNDLLIDFSGNEITYLTPQNASLLEYIPVYEGNYVDVRSNLDPKPCALIPEYNEPSVVVVGDYMPDVVKSLWYDPIGTVVEQQSYINYVSSLPTGTVSAERSEMEIARAEYAQYNGISNTASAQLLSELQLLSGNIWRRIELGYHIQNEDYNGALSTIQNYSIENAADTDFVFLQGIVIAKLIHESSTINTPYTVTNGEDNLIIDIINKSSIMSGYASSIYYDLHGEVVLPEVKIETRSIKNMNEGDASPPQPDVIVYPNPANHTLHIDGLEEGAEIEIYDIFKNQVKSAYHTPEKAINISELTHGIYFIKTTNNRVIRFFKS